MNYLDISYYNDTSHTVIINWSDSVVELAGNVTIELACNLPAGREHLLADNICQLVAKLNMVS